MSCTKLEATTILKEVYDEGSAVLGCVISDAYLYGSFARGTYHSESDVDILLTLDLTKEEDLFLARRKISTIASKLSLKHDVTVSITVKPAEQFAKYSTILPFYINVIRDGIRYTEGK